MIKSKTYVAASGLNFIQDSDLAFAKIIAVKKEGIQHDKYIGGTNNRTYIHGESTGKIIFPINFNGEKVFVIYKATGSEPVTPPGVCIPATVLAISLPDPIVGLPYNKTIGINGTGPITLSGITIPTWAAISISSMTNLSIVYISGTPDTPGPATFAFTPSNCAGTAAPSSFDVDVQPDDPTLTVVNNLAGTGIISITGPSYSTLTGSMPVASGATLTGIHAFFFGIVKVNITGVSFPGTLKMYKNGVLHDTKVVDADGIRSFSVISMTTSDIILITLE